MARHSQGTGARWGWKGYARMLRCVVDAPHSSDEIAAICGYFALNVRRFMRRMQDLRHDGHPGVYVHAWETRPHTVPMPVWAFGDGHDAPKPLIKRNGKPHPRTSVKPSVEVILFYKILDALMTGAHSAKTLADECGINRNEAKRLLNHLHRKVGMAYIADWDRRTQGGGPHTAMYQFGIDHKDKSKPRPLPRRVVEKHSRERRRKRAVVVQITQALASNASVFTYAQAA